MQTTDYSCLKARIVYSLMYKKKIDRTVLFKSGVTRVTNVMVEVLPT